MTTTGSRLKPGNITLGWWLAMAAASTVVAALVVGAMGQRADASPVTVQNCEPLVQATRGLQRLQFARTAACANELRAAWANTVGLAYGALWLDFALIALYVATLFMFCRWVARLGDSNGWSRLLRLGSFAAVAAGIFDVIENVGLFAMLGGATAGSWPRLVFWCATIKFALVGAVLLLALTAWIGHESRRATFLNRTPKPRSDAPPPAAHSAFSTALAYVWPLRVPLLTAVALIALAFFTGQSRYLSGLFDPVAETAVLPIATLALLCAWSAAITLSLIVAYGEARLLLPRGRQPITRVPGHIWVAGAAIAAPIVYFTIERSHDFSGRSRGAMVLYATVGAISACLMLAFTLRSARWLSDYAENHSSAWLYHKALVFLKRWQFSSAGFLDDKPSLLPGHGIAAFLALVSLATYVVVGLVTRDVARPEYASALLYVLLLILVLSWILGVLAFVLDRTRVPLLVYFILWAVAMNLASGLFPTDHEYETFLLDARPPSGTAGVALLADSPTPIVVAASGGGIQAAAWTSQVLAGLAERIPAFPQHVQVISAVSGGSVGAMHFLTQQADCGPESGPPRPTHPSVAVQRAMESSLHAVGWGLVYQDLPRTIVPFLTDPRVDRGLLMEDAWKRDRRLGEPVDPAAPRGRDALLSTWQRNVPEGRCPGAIFNAMVANTGEPMLFTTIALPKALTRFAFQSHYPKLDLKLTTAARLSATFPYVSPAARAQHDTDRAFARDLGNGQTEARYNHVVDGGYFDNFGVATATEWIHGALQELPTARPPRILLIEICESNSCSSDNPGDVPAFGDDVRRSWSFQLYAPISALLAMRRSAQRARNRWHIDLLKQRWHPGVCIESVKFAYPAEPGPMSWHLTERQKKAITGAWGGTAPQQAARRVQDFLSGGTGPCR
jgi:hypothetical protein